MNIQSLNELQKIYEIAQAKFEVAEELAMPLATTSALAAYFYSYKWWVGVLVFPLVFIASRYKYKKNWLAAEEAYYDVVNAE